MLKAGLSKKIEKAAPLRLRFSEVKVFLESTLTALRMFQSQC